MYFHAKVKIFQKFWLMTVDVHFPQTGLQRRNEAVVITWQKLYPVFTTRRVRFYTVVFQNIERSIILKIFAIYAAFLLTFMKTYCLLFIRIHNKIKLEFKSRNASSFHDLVRYIWNINVMHYLRNNKIMAWIPQCCY